MAKSLNKNLHKAKVEKNDEFYTQLSDIERELVHYRNQFRDKVVLCNCDDPRESQFFHYFFMNFKFLGLKKLICTCYKNQQWDLFSTKESEKAVYIVYDGPTDDSPEPHIEDIRVMPLEGDGDFRSKECLMFLEHADIVVTNPPFSLFREFVATMVKYNKKFIIIGHQNAIKYKEIFPLIMDKKLWLGYGFKGGATHFMSTYEDKATSGDHKDGMIRVSGVHWFTNMIVKGDKEPVVLVKKYRPEDYPKYDNYDAINVDKVVDIPNDYFGEIGVPITFLDKWNPSATENSFGRGIVTTNDFEIIGGFNNSNLKDKEEFKYVKSTNTVIIDKDNKESLFNGPVINKKALYYRIIIKRKQQSAL